MSRELGGLTLACRYACSALVLVPLAYWNFASEGDAYHFLAMVLVAPLAGLVLMVNSLIGLYRYRQLEAPWVGLLFVVIGAVGVLEALYFLPQFKMH